MSTVKPFKISVPDSQLEILQKKLEITTFPDELDNSEWDLGAPLDDIKRLTEYWKDKFDWRKAEKRLNEQVPQFTVDVDVAGFDKLNIHFVHKRSKRGFGLAQYAEALHGVMMALGYEEYAIQGGDWGGIISRVMAKLYPSHVKAVHTNFIILSLPYPWRTPLLFLKSLFTLPFSKKDQAKLAVSMNYLTQGNGYMAQQGSRPQTLGYSLQDSPVGLLAWIYEKLHAWTDSYPWTEDEVLTWVSIYLFSRAGPAASTRIYYEFNHAPSGPGSVSSDDAATCYSPDVKFAVAHFPREMLTFPMLWCRSIGNVVRETEFEKGGHFAAWEVPEDLAADIQGFFGKKGQAYRALVGTDGY
ncbi:putative microsomal epoxide hydrolase [Microsporum audouinii]